MFIQSRGYSQGSEAQTRVPPEKETRRKDSNKLEILFRRQANHTHGFLKQSSESGVFKT